MHYHSAQNSASYVNFFLARVFSIFSHPANLYENDSNGHGKLSDSLTSVCLPYMFQHRYRPCRFDFIENIDLYASGGLHPVSIGDVFADGRYKVLHKLGFGGSSTTWLARDSISGILVALKVLAAYISTKPKDEIEELVISRKLDALITSTQCC